MDQVILSGLTVLAHWAALMPAYRISGGHSIKIQDPSYSQINALVSEHSSRPIQHTAGHFRDKPFQEKRKYSDIYKLLKKLTPMQANCPQLRKKMQNTQSKAHYSKVTVYDVFKI